MLGSIGRGVALGSDLTLLRIATVGALASALALTGCGRKGPLDAPPSAAISEPATDAQPNSAAGIGPDGKPIAPPPSGSKRWTPLDVLLD